MQDLEATSQFETLAAAISDIRHIEDEPPARGGREGLPKSYRSRHDSHYVEHLIAERALPLLRVLPVANIDAADLPDAAQVGALKESIVRFGVLQPILVRAHDGRFTLIAGRRRLAAARAANLREIPCLVHSVPESDAAALADAVNEPADRIAARPAPVDSEAAAPPAACDPLTRASLAEVQDALLTVRASLQWLPRPSGNTRERVANLLLRADLERAEWVVTARQYLAGALRVTPASTTGADLLAVIGRAAPAVSLHGGMLEIAPPPQGLEVAADRVLLAAAARGIIWTLLAMGERAGDRRVRVSLTAGAGPGRAVLAIAQPATVLTQQDILRFFEEEWSERPGGTTSDLAVRLTRFAAERHGAGLEVSSAAGEGTSVTLAFG